MKKALSLIVMMSCVAVFCSCRSAAQKQPAGASQERYFLGTYSAVFPCSLRMMDKAVRETCAKSKLIEVNRSNSITTCSYLYKDVNNIPLKIELEERKDGNLEFEQARKSVKKSIDQIDIPEVQDFMSECVPGFSLTLDEISEP